MEKLICPIATGTCGECGCHQVHIEGDDCRSDYACGNDNDITVNCVPATNEMIVAARIRGVKDPKGDCDGKNK
jgi:hypothetical protein